MTPGATTTSLRRPQSGPAGAEHRSIEFVAERERLGLAARGLVQSLLLGPDQVEHSGAQHDGGMLDHLDELVNRRPQQQRHGEGAVMNAVCLTGTGGAAPNSRADTGTSMRLRSPEPMLSLEVASARS